MTTFHQRYSGDLGGWSEAGAWRPIRGLDRCSGRAWNDQHGWLLRYGRQMTMRVVLGPVSGASGPAEGYSTRRLRKAGILLLNPPTCIHADDQSQD